MATAAQGSFQELPCSHESRRLLKNRLSEYVRIAAAGELVLVTDRDRVVAMEPNEAWRPSQRAGEVKELS